MFCTGGVFFGRWGDHNCRKKHKRGKVGGNRCREINSGTTVSGGERSEGSGGARIDFLQEERMRGFKRRSQRPRTKTVNTSGEGGWLSRIPEDQQKRQKG